MTYREALDHLYNQLPMFQRVGAPAFKKDLTNTIHLMEMLQHPEQQFKSIHIAGTNGKGSVTHMIAAVLQSAGYKTGIYSSPHLKDFRERIKINGELMPETDVVDFVEKYRSQYSKLQPSFFEITVAMAFDHFAREKVDIAVIETGMGGRLDSTNVITPLLSVITNISLEHQQFLGNTRTEIAGEKAGIIKEKVPVVIGENHPETEEVFFRTATAKHSEIYFADKMLTARIKKHHIEEIMLDVGKGSQLIYQDLHIQSGAAYQIKNTITALQALRVLSETGFDIPTEAVYKGFKDYKNISNFPGRWVIFQQDPLIIADTAHNPAGLELVFEQLSHFTFEERHIVLGMVQDKDVKSALSVLPENAIYYFCKPDVPRGLDENELQKEARKNNRQGEAFPSVKAALKAAKVAAGKKDLIYIGGSTFVVAEVI